jgi:HAD superfamily hydrolase (TIGR01509 family)
MKKAEKKLEKNIKAIIFDIGGTLVKKQKNGQRNLSDIKNMASLLKTTDSPEKLISEITAGEKVYKTWKKRTLVELPVEKRWSDYLLPHYPENFVRQHAEILQDWWSKSNGKKWVTEETVYTLRELYARGYIMATASHTSPKYLDEAGIMDLFQVTLYAPEFGRRKPHPSIFLAAARACGVNPQECAYIGDRPSRDLIGAREAGYGQVILLQTDAEAEVEPCPMRADRIIHNISDLLSVYQDFVIKKSVMNSKPDSDVLYDASLSTMWWNKERDNAETFFNKGKKLGFMRFEPNHQITPEEFASINLNAFHMGSLHDPCPAVISTRQLDQEDRLISSLNENLRKTGVEVVKRTIELAHDLSAGSVVIHPGRITGDHSMDNRLRDLFREGLQQTPEYLELQRALIADRKARSYPHLDALMKSLFEILAFTKDSGISLGLENRLRYYEMPIFDEMEVILNEFQQPWIGWQLDTGHLQIHDALGLESFPKWLTKFGSRIIGVHLHDVQGILDHRAPGCGDVDFKLIGEHLPPYSVRTLEVDKSVSFEEIKSGMKVLVETGCVTQI